MTATIDSSATAQVLNSCNIANNHAFSVLAVFNIEGDYLYMMRNPWNFAKYEGKWSQSDTDSWTDVNVRKIQKRLIIDPLTSQDEFGIFFMDENSFHDCFQQYQIAHVRDKEGFVETWYDFENDNGIEKSYQIKVSASDSDIYISSETYYYQMVPLDCRDYPPIVKMRVYNGVSWLGTNWYYDSYHNPFLIEEFTYTPVSRFNVKVEYSWNESPAKDYTLKVYSKFSDL